MTVSERINNSVQILNIAFTEYILCNTLKSLKLCLESIFPLETGISSHFCIVPLISGD